MVSVLSQNKKPLMPCTQRRARKLLESGRAKPYWYKGFFCIIMQQETKTFKQDIAVGIDIGSKMCGLTVKSNASTILNIQYAAKTKVKDKVKERREARNGRRRRNTPYRKCRFNRNVKNRIPPSTKSRWQQHLNLINFCNKMYPISHIAFEDVAAQTKKGARKWNVNFSPLEVGKQWCYTEIEKEFKLTLYKGFDTFTMRNELGLKKGKDKLKVAFYSHCVDSWTLANDLIGGHIEIDNVFLTYLSPLNLYRRQLHVFCPSKNGVRRNYGGTLSMGLKRGTLVIHPRYGKVLIGGTSNDKISLHNVETNLRICQRAKPSDLKILTNFNWNIKMISGSIPHS